MIAEICAVQIPLDNLCATELRGDLRREDAFANGAAHGGRLVVKHEPADKFLCDGGVKLRIVVALNGITRMSFELWVGYGNGSVDQIFRNVLRVLRVDGNVTARRVVRREGEE